MHILTASPPLVEAVGSFCHSLAMTDQGWELIWYSWGKKDSESSCGSLDLKQK